MKLLSFYAICIHVCIENKNNILKTLLYDYIKSKYSQKQMYMFYLKVASIDKNTDMYKLMNRLIVQNSNQLIKKFLYDKINL